MWAIGLELVIPALLLLMLWRIWPKETDDAGDASDNDATSASPNENPHDDSPR